MQLESGKRFEVGEDFSTVSCYFREMAMEVS